jgi:hypothetical protein
MLAEVQAEVPIVLARAALAAVVILGLPVVQTRVVVLVQTQPAVQEL